MASKRTVFIVNLVLSVFFLANALSIWSGLSIYPGGWHYVLVAAVLGNLLWLLLPLILRRHSSPFFRMSRAVLGPFWVLWNFLIFLYSAFILLLGLAWLASFSWKWVPFTRFAHLPSNIFLIAIGLICLVGFFQALFLLKVERVPIRIKNLPPEFAGFKIAMLSDLHVGLFTRLSRLRQFTQAAQATQPDLLVICGDLTDDDPQYLPRLLKSLEVLDPFLPAVGVLGNHDVYANPEKTLNVLEDSRLRMLVNEGMALKRGTPRFGSPALATRGHGSSGSGAPWLRILIRPWTENRLAPPPSCWPTSRRVSRRPWKGGWSSP